MYVKCQVKFFCVCLKVIYEVVLMLEGSLGVVCVDYNEVYVIS